MIVITDLWALMPVKYFKNKYQICVRKWPDLSKQGLDVNLASFDLIRIMVHYSGYVFKTKD